jgi:hypothetical protein
MESTRAQRDEPRFIPPLKSDLNIKDYLEYLQKHRPNHLKKLMNNARENCIDTASFEKIFEWKLYIDYAAAMFVECFINAVPNCTIAGYEPESP